MNKNFALVLLFAFAPLAHADQQSPSGDRVLENPASNGGLKLRVNVGGTKTDALTITGASGAVAVGSSTATFATPVAVNGSIRLNTGNSGNNEVYLGTSANGYPVIGYNLLGTATALTYSRPYADNAYAMTIGPGGSSGVFEWNYFATGASNVLLSPSSTIMSVNTTGVLTTAGGIKLPTTGGTASTLDAYEDTGYLTPTLAASTIAISSGGGTCPNCAGSIRFVRIGKSVTVTFSITTGAGVTGTSGGPAGIAAQGAGFPAQFRPSSLTQTCGVGGDTGSANGAYYLAINSGQVTMYKRVWDATNLIWNAGIRFGCSTAACGSQVSETTGTLACQYLLN